MKGLPRSLARGSKAKAPILKQTVKIAHTISNIDGAADAVAFGTAVIGDLPVGNILFLGAAGYLQFTKTTSGIQDAFDGDFSIGSAPTADVTLSGAEVDILPSTALGAATSGVSPRVRSVNATQVMLDNTDGSLELNLNLLIDNANINADDQIVNAVGVLELAYIVLLDD